MTFHIPWQDKGTTRGAFGGNGIMTTKDTRVWISPEGWKLTLFGNELMYPGSYNSDYDIAVLKITGKGLGDEIYNYATLQKALIEVPILYEKLSQGNWRKETDYDINISPTKWDDRTRPRPLTLDTDISAFLYMRDRPRQQQWWKTHTFKNAPLNEVLDEITRHLRDMGMNPKKVLVRTTPLTLTSGQKPERVLGPNSLETLLGELKSASRVASRWAIQDSN